ncbi:hypothetical protein [Nitrosopumilus sp.]|uniref:hypothetical protein n=1 Tax=Nitrosopumilus sp. TaxID=2024843 RepID=UPI003B5B34AF
MSRKNGLEKASPYVILVSDVVGSTKEKAKNELIGEMYVKDHNDIILKQIDKLASRFPDLSQAFGGFKRSSSNVDFILKVLGDGVLLCVKEKESKKHNLFEILIDLAEKTRAEFVSKNINARIVLNYGDVRTYRYQNLNFRDPISLTIDETFKISKMTRYTDILLSSSFYDKLPPDFKIKRENDIVNPTDFYLEGDPDETPLPKQMKKTIHRLLSGTEDESPLMDMWGPKYIYSKENLVEKYKKIVKRWTNNKSAKKLSIRSYYTPIFGDEIIDVEKSFINTKSNTTERIVEKLVDIYFYPDQNFVDFRRSVSSIAKKNNKFSLRYTLKSNPIYFTIFLEDDKPIEAIIVLDSINSKQDDLKIGWYIHPEYVSTSSQSILQKINEMFISEWNNSKLDALK